jgi:uncharacterized membrane protein
MNSIVLPIHITTGGLALALGAVPLLVKGETVHRRSGLLFVYTMLVMGLSAAILRVAKILPEPFTTAPMRTLSILLIVRRDVILAVEGPRPVHVASRRSP